MTTITDPAATVKSGDSPIARTLRQLGTDTAYVFVGFPLGIALEDASGDGHEVQYMLKPGAEANP